MFIAANLIIVSLSEAITRARLRAQAETSQMREEEQQLPRLEIEARARQSSGFVPASADAVRDGSCPGTHCTMRHRFPIPLRQPAICGTVGTHPNS